MPAWKTVRLGLTGAFGLIALAMFAYSLQGGVPISHASDDAHAVGRYKITLRCDDANVEVPFGTFKNKAGIVTGGGSWSDAPSELKCAKGDTDTKAVTITDPPNNDNWSSLTVLYRCPKGDPNLRELIIPKVVMGQFYPLPNCPDANSPTITVKPDSVGGIAELPDVAGTPLEAPGSSGSNTGLLTSPAGAVAAGILALGGAAWYARRRWAR